MQPLYIGLMSGTSLDGVDGVLVRFGGAAGPVQVLAHHSCRFDDALGTELLALNAPGGPDELQRAALAANALARLYSQVVAELLTSSTTPREAITAIAAHGQTVRHRPGEFDGTGFTLQLNSPALLAELTGIDVIADFRSRDVAAGGSGAPLVPAFHRAVFGRPRESLAVLNLGGIANLTVLHADGSTGGFDCGPANVLLDLWCRRNTGQAYDDQGRSAASGQVLEPLLARLRSEAFFSLPPPKSTGRDRFHAAWLDAHLSTFTEARPQDVQATLSELTASVCARDIRLHAPQAVEVLVCGGGAFNSDLMARLAKHLPAIAVQPTDARGLPALQVEACAFAWLASAFLARRPGNVSAVTGAAGPRILGALYPAR